MCAPGDMKMRYFIWKFLDAIHTFYSFTRTEGKTALSNLEL